MDRDLDTDGETKLAELTSSNSVPIPTAIVGTPWGKYEVHWRVEGFAFGVQESTLKVLDITFGGDLACTDWNKVLPLPGVLIQKYDPAQSLTVEYPKDPFGATHRVYLDTPPLIGRCRALGALVGAVLKLQDLQDQQR